MSSDVELLDGLDEYRWDFVDPATHVFTTGKGLNEKVVRQISAQKHEPEWSSGSEAFMTEAHSPSSSTFTSMYPAGQRHPRIHSTTESKS